ncbi:glyoxalase [Micromonospora qiuiae]|uniref:Glyoxalase n=1 Tax=Micromonospora qiuiae TaxID=502268 RepID=A0ABQ4J5T4_9ACTN|nr:VOC family protein [Micromonospora qiuiae]GIJ25510.1 glyoxalase [Micromonospora qiuiae]
MPPKLTVTAINFDCPDPTALVEFYRQATGSEISSDFTDDFVGLRGQNGLFIGFQRVDGYQPPSWPAQRSPQQLHLDFAVDDVDEAEAMVLALGATKADFQPGGDRWRVYLDPAGHPFCLLKA